jgi:glutathione synthase/RimK-type ligase-like ATP-grasp enzyme
MDGRNMHKLWVYSGDRPSNGAKELASQDGFLRLRDGRFHKIKPEHQVINWGVSAAFGTALNVLNNPINVKRATNKLEAFIHLSAQDVNTVEWSDDKSDAIAWAGDKKTVVVRNKLTGHSGDGIVIIEPGSVLPTAPLYTQYVFKTKEFRVHVVNGKVIDTQQKIKDPTREPTTWKVRSHANGFIFARNGIVSDPLRDQLAVAAVSALGLDFGAVDIIQDKKGQLFVLEINTAPGLEGQTIDNYATAFRAYVSGN